jgi:uncharacterized membrane protein (UPF0127 family)
LIRAQSATPRRLDTSLKRWQTFFRTGGLASAAAVAHFDSTPGTHMSRARYAPLLTAIAITSALSACTVHAAGTTVELKGHKFDVEIADTPETRARGLMFRDSMAADHGMLFLFDRADPQAFWMKNTHIPLDILYFDENYKLVSMQERVPPCRSDPCSVYPSTGPAKYVLELNSGTAEKLGVKAGDVLTVTR